MTIAAKKTVLADFDVEYLGIESPSYFQGFGGAFTDFAFSTYGIGDTEEEALDNCMDSMATSGDFDFTEENEKRDSCRLWRLFRRNGCR